MQTHYVFIALRNSLFQDYIVYFMVYVAVVYQKPKLSAKTESFQLSVSAAKSKG